MPAIPITQTISTETTTSPKAAITMATDLLKRSSMSDPSKYPLYVFVIIIGCIFACLIGFSVYAMFHGLDDTEQFKDVSSEQRQYMRETRYRNLNRLAIEARRPDMIIPIKPSSDEQV
ncbi:hypothetical protein N7535_000388 [Penicillium sp. DV-2018c]|nr:hypothetical protein N7461_006365 [Penicillium sp. DV-2018c]KAJ5581768.1 hypothetical protein N7535_000388 [Penicillium sp. DV-2018c]